MVHEVDLWEDVMQDGFSVSLFADPASPISCQSFDIHNVE